MDGEAGELGEVAERAGFELLREVVDAGDGEGAVQGGVAGGEDFALDLADLDVVAVEQFGKLVRGVAEVGFERAAQFVELGGGDDVVPESLDVSVDLSDLRELAVDLALDTVSERVGFAESEVFVHFGVKLKDEAGALAGPGADLVGGEFVHGEVVLLGDGADLVEEVFVGGGARLHVDDYVGFAYGGAHGGFDLVGDDVDALKGNGAGN